jgi:outer membrane protein
VFGPWRYARPKERIKGVVMKMRVLLVATALAAAGVSAPAIGADLKPLYKAPPPVEVWSPWQIRVRALGVLPQSSGSTVNVSGAPLFSTPNSGLNIGNSTVPELDISYYFTKNLAAELILGVTPHHIDGTGALAGLDVGRTWLLPPSLTFQYHFTDFGAFQPYLGVGANYTVMFDQTAGNTINNGVAITGLHVKNSAGAVAQAGFDYMIDRHWGLNFDVKKIYLEPGYTATATAGPVSLPINGQANINPWLIGGGVTYRF